MTMLPLPHRCLVAVTGEDAAPFLEGLITAKLPPEGEARGAALLTPQGKILFTVLLSRAEGGFRLECEAFEREALMKRLGLYKLRAKVAIEADETPVLAGEGGALTDSRHAGMGTRSYGVGGPRGDAAAYAARRVACGVLEGPGEILEAQDFPHDVALDLTGALAFDKGCFVGQEVVSRVKHRGTARRRPVIVHGAGLAAGDALTCGEREIGTIRLVAEGSALAVLRIDQVKGPVAAPSGPVELALPPYATYQLAGDGADDDG